MVILTVFSMTCVKATDFLLMPGCWNASSWGQRSQDVCLCHFLSTQQCVWCSLYTENWLVKRKSYLTRESFHKEKTKRCKNIWKKKKNPQTTKQQHRNHPDVCLSDCLQLFLAHRHPPSRTLALATTSGPCLVWSAGTKCFLKLYTTFIVCGRNPCLYILRYIRNKEFYNAHPQSLNLQGGNWKCLRQDAVWTRKPLFRPARARAWASVCVFLLVSSSGPRLVWYHPCWDQLSLWRQEVWMELTAVFIVIVLK